jgi:hypothetical protein
MDYWEESKGTRQQLIFLCTNILEEVVEIIIIISKILQLDLQRSFKVLTNILNTSNNRITTNR